MSFKIPDLLSPWPHLTPLIPPQALKKIEYPHTVKNAVSKMEHPMPPPVIKNKYTPKTKPSFGMIAPNYDVGINPPK